MKIFISWSGEKSRTFAEALKPWLEQVLPGTEVWLSSEDIDKGTIWFTQIINELENCSCGVLCITKENRNSPWIHFEAGGMIKGLGKSKVATILLDLDYGDLGQPLNQFNGLRMDRTGARHLIKSFNKVSERPLQERIIEKYFGMFWAELEQAYRAIFPQDQDPKDGSPEQPTSNSVYIVPDPNDSPAETPRSGIKFSAPPPTAVAVPITGEIGPDGQLYLFG